MFPRVSPCSFERDPLSVTHRSLICHTHLPVATNLHSAPGLHYAGQSLVMLGTKIALRIISNVSVNLLHYVLIGMFYLIKRPSECKLRLTNRLHDGKL